MKYLEEFRDPELAERLLTEIHSVTTRPWALMEVCGGQTHSIIRHGIDQLLPDKIELILKVTRDTGMVTFSTLFVSAASRHEIVCTFLALLELIRLKQLAVRQDRSFGDILVTRVDVK